LIFHRFVQNFLKKKQAATSDFSKECCENPGNMPNIRNKRVTILKRNRADPPSLQKSCANSKADAVKRKNVKILYDGNGRIKKIIKSWRTTF
jgi:hypothetical protein